jgi:hypothetical protein
MVILATVKPRPCCVTLTMVATSAASGAMGALEARSTAICRVAQARCVGRGLGRQSGRQLSWSWRMAHAKAVKVALPDAFFDSLGLPRLLVPERLNPPNRRMRTRMSGGVAGVRG